MNISLRTFVGLAAVAAMALVLTPVAAAGTPATYTDPAGDAKSAPDVTKVSVDLDAESNLVSFVIEFAGPEELANDGGVFIALDTDRNTSTGDRAGSDYLVGVFANGAGMLKWNGSEFATFTHRAMAIGRDSGKVATIFCACDIGTQTFDFAVVGSRGNDIDVAPDTGATFPIPAIDIQSFVYAPKPLLPKAGKRFTLKPLGIRLGGTNEVVMPESLACSAKLAGKALKGSGTGGCSWLLPKKSKGKKLTVIVTVSYQGQTETFSQTFKVT
jgi:hypothetical protein